MDAFKFRIALRTCFRANAYAFDERGNCSVANTNVKPHVVQST